MSAGKLSLGPVSECLATGFGDVSYVQWKDFHKNCDDNTVEIIQKLTTKLERFKLRECNLVVCLPNSLLLLIFFGSISTSVGNFCAK